MKQVLEYFGDVEPFLRENENDHLAPAKLDNSWTSLMMHLMLKNSSWS